MFTNNVVQLFREFVDEPDSSWLSDTMLQHMMHVAHQQYRNLIVDINPWIFANAVELEFADTHTYQLGGAGPVVIAGPGAPVALTAARLDRIIALATNPGAAGIGFPPADASPVFEWTCVNSLPQLDSTARSYMLWSRLSFLQLSEVYTGSLFLYYVFQTPAVGEAGCLWTPLSAINFIDDFNTFHDVIALLAAERYYSVRDGATNEQVSRLAKIRSAELQDYISEMHGHGMDYVRYEDLHNIFGGL